MSTSKRRYIFRDVVVDLSTAAKAGSRMHMAMVRMVESTLTNTEVLAVLSVAYYQDMTEARSGEADALVLPEDVGNVVGVTQSLAGAWLRIARAKGFLVGSANAGYTLPRTWWEG